MKTLSIEGGTERNYQYVLTMMVIIFSHLFICSFNLFYVACPQVRCMEIRIDSAPVIEALMSSLSSWR